MACEFIVNDSASERNVNERSDPSCSKLRSTYPFNWASKRSIMDGNPGTK